MGAMFPFLQSPGTSPDCHDLSDIMESGLAYIKELYVMQYSAKNAQVFGISVQRYGAGPEVKKHRLC